MRIPFLYGEFELTIDSKNRLLVPAEIRGRIIPETDGQALFATLRNKTLLLYPERYYEELVGSQIRPVITPGRELLDYQYLTISLASRLEWDSQGRVVLPDRFIRRAELSREVTLVGNKDHLELWDREKWNRKLEQLLEESAAIYAAGADALARQAGGQPGEHSNGT